MNFSMKMMAVGLAAAALATGQTNQAAPGTPRPIPGAPAMPAQVTAPEIVRLDPALDAIIAPGTQIEKFATGFTFAEGPVWRDGKLYFSDVVGNKMYSITPDGKATVLIDHAGGLDSYPAGMSKGSNGMVNDKDGSLLMTQHGLRRIVRLDDKLSMKVFLDNYEGKKFNSPNDLVFAPDGALWITDPPYGLTGEDRSPDKEMAFNGVFRYANGKLTAPIKDLRRPNGIGFTKDGRTLYVSNSGPQMYVERYKVAADGSVSDGTIFIDYPGRAPDVPDGLKLDSADNLWTSGPGGIRIISPAGKVLGQIKLPETAANLAWADSGRTLYITASTSVYRLKVVTLGAMPLYRK